MRIYMQIPPIDNQAPRFYHLHLQEDMLEGWTLVREWGFQGSGGRVKRVHYAERSDAIQALIRIRDDQIRKGYRVVFMQGMDQP